MATIVGDVLGLQQRHHPKNILHLVKKIKGFPLKVKSFRNSATCQNSRVGYHRMYVRELIAIKLCLALKKKKKKKVQGTRGGGGTPLVSFDAPQ